MFFGDYFPKDYFPGDYFPPTGIPVYVWKGVELEAITVLAKSHASAQPALKFDTIILVPKRGITLTVDAKAEATASLPIRLSSTSVAPKTSGDAAVTTKGDVSASTPEDASTIHTHKASLSIAVRSKPTLE